MKFRLVGDHCPITGNLVTARVIDDKCLFVPGTTIVYCASDDYAALTIAAGALRKSVTVRKEIKSRKTKTP